MRNTRAILCALATTWLAGLPAASAQIFVGTSAPVLAMPSPAGDISDARPAPTPPPSHMILRHLPATLDGLRLTGESGELAWPLTLTAAQARGARSFRLAYETAISVLPDASWVSVRINGREIGRQALNAADGLHEVAFEVPADLLVGGVNAVSVSLKQRHRVDCSLAATYELWTRIDPAQTGLVLDRAEAYALSDLSDFAAVLPQVDGSLPIHVVLSGKTNPAHLQRLIKATQAIALLTRTQQPSVDFAEDAGSPYGVDVALGTRAALKQLARLADQLGDAGPLLRLVASASSRPTLVVTGTSEAEVDAAVDLLAATPPSRGTPEGRWLIDRQAGVASTGDALLSLRDAGLPDQDVDGRLFRMPLHIRLPADVLASDYGRGSFDLDGAYAAGLERGAQIRIDVNGRNAGIVKLPNANGDTFRHSQLFLPLGLMRPGLNRIDVIAQLPRPEDAACVQSQDRRLLLRDSTHLTLPVLAHVRRLPDLSLASAGALPYDAGIAHLVVPRPDRQTMAAALSLTARLAVAAGRPLPFAFATTIPTSDDGSILVVSPARQLDPQLVRSIGLEPGALETAWRARAAATSADAPKWWLAHADSPAACRAESTLVASSMSSGTARVAPGTGGEDLVETVVPAVPAWTTRVAAGAHEIGNWLSAQADAILPASTPHTTNAISPEAALVVAQGLRSRSSDHVTTIVTAPNAAELRAATACLGDPAIWSKVTGRLAVLDARSGDVATTPATSFRYVSSGRVSLGNARLVLAGWLSLNPLAFAAMALLTALCLSGTTLWFVRGVGRRSK